MHLVSIRTTWATLTRQRKLWGLYQYKVTYSRAVIQRPGHWADNSKMAYCWLGSQRRFLSLFRCWSSVILYIILAALNVMHGANSKLLFIILVPHFHGSVSYFILHLFSCQLMKLWALGLQRYRSYKVGRYCSDQLHRTQTIQWTNQNSVKWIHFADAKHGKICASEVILALVLPLVGRESGASFLRVCRETH